MSYGNSTPAKRVHQVEQFAALIRLLGDDPTEIHADRLEHDKLYVYIRTPAGPSQVHVSTIRSWLCRGWIRESESEPAHIVWEIVEIPD